MPRTKGSLTRRGAMLLPLAAAGCQTLDNWFGQKKTPLPGQRTDVLTVKRGLTVDNPPARAVTLPPQSVNAAWAQTGAGPTHAPGNLALGRGFAQAWSAHIGAGSAYRRKIPASPVVAGGRVFAMDSDAVVSGYDQKSGAQIWRTETKLEDVRSTEAGGGISLDGGTLYAATGLLDLLAIDPRSGKILWRQKLPSPARAAPTIVGDALYVPTLNGEVLAMARKDGGRIWSYQGPIVPTIMLGLPSPAYADGLLVAGFGSGQLACLRAPSGAVTWTDGLAGRQGAASMLDIASVHGLPVIDEGRVYAASLGGLFVSNDLRSGRRLWEREIASQQTPWLAGDWLFITTPNQVVAAVNRGDGAVAWVTQLPRYEDEKDQSGPIRWTGPIVAGDRLILAGSTGEVLTVNPVTGALGARQKVGGAAAVSPVVADRTLYLLTVDGDLLALR